MNIWSAKAPSNIALIKYMGKTDATQNIPCNSSLSYTLDHLYTLVELEQTTDAKDRWEPLRKEDLYSIALAEKAQSRFLKHLQWLKEQFDYKGSFIVRSANSFPSDCGLASSSSSFAALTKCVCLALAELTNSPLLSDTKQAQLSRQGSGSSCRSFFEPWGYWHNEEVETIELPYTNLIHQVIVVAEGKKSVSSSQAHQRVMTSLLFENRPQRAEKRLYDLIQALKEKNWQQAYSIVWQEFQDMHALFTTANPPFNYLYSDTLLVLNSIQQLWEVTGDGPLVTLDAGPNIHLLYRPDQKNLAKKIEQQWQRFMVLTNE